MTNRRMQAATVAATAGGGLLTAALLQAAVATAAPGTDAFTIDGTVFDPITATGTQGFDPVSPLNMGPPLLALGGGTALGVLNLAPQSFDLYNGTTSLGSIDTNETVTNLLGLSNTAFTVLDTTAADGVEASALPVKGTVYDVLNLGNGYYNVYIATPGEHGTVTDTLVTPFGNTDLSSLFGTANAANPLQPGDAFAALQAGNSSIGADAFSIGGFTFNPFSESGGTTTAGFTPVDPIASAPPLLNLGGGQLVFSLAYPGIQPTPFAPQEFDVYSGTGSGATELGSIKTAVDVTNLLGMTNTQFIVQSATAADGVDATSLPVLGSVYDAFNLGGGWANVYTATPDVTAADGTVTTPGTVHDTLVTPFGNMNLDSLFGGINAANPLDPGDAFTGLHVADSSLGDDAFSLGGFVFDPFTEFGTTRTDGFHIIPSLIGAAPLLNIGGATVGLAGAGAPINFSPQDFDIYGGTGASPADLGSITTSLNTSNLLGMINTEFTVATVTATEGVDATTLPAVGTVYDVLNFGGGWQNIYIATPGADGTITDTLVTPFGNVDLSSLFDMFNAANPLDPGAAFTGLDDVGAALASDPLALFGF
ncbi:hypothetical protein [[Mycobacterium] nativiensis]|uniref:PE-PGRS family protein n=1 Tax=[Mycobacterium] nativiensis TaxID=2855503 RepID=A0ABU5XQQ0_9MYCO|nr:hypothetical protein [Mycolicibacter sp. MYC340]MEB3030253.1 hypothetical protein [Mycolicibacter sp. MYC340]